MEGAWHSPNTILNMIQCQAFRFIIHQSPHREGPHYLPPRDMQNISVFEPWGPSLVPSKTL